MKKLQSGFTLVELLVASVVFSLLMMLISFSMSTGTRIWQKEQGSYQAELVNEKALFQLYNSIEQITPLTELAPLNNVPTPMLFFDGTAEKVTFYSKQGVYYPELVKTSLSCVNSGQTLQLEIYEVKEFTGESISNVLLENLVACNFSYYARPIKFSNDDLSVELNLSPTWFSSFSGSEIRRLPEQLRVQWQTMANSGQPSLRQLQVPIRINDNTRFETLEPMVSSL